MGLVSKRSLKFYCNFCESTKDLYPDLISLIIDRLKPVFQAELKDAREENESRFTSLSQQIADLVETNKDLIKIVSPIPAVGHLNQVPHPRSKVNNSFSGSIPTAGMQVESSSEKSGQRNLVDLQMPSAHINGSNDAGPSSLRPSKHNMQPVKSRRQNFIRGSMPTPAVSVGSDRDTFAAVARRAHLYIGNVNPNASKDVIDDYIRERLPDTAYVLEDLPRRDGAISRAYKLSLDFSLLETLNKPEFWPQGVVVKRFFRPRNPQQGGVPQALWQSDKSM